MSLDGFQAFVNNELPPAKAGDFAGAAIHVSNVAGFNKFVAPPSGTNTGLFGWGSAATGLATNYFQPAAAIGFVHAEEQALITGYLANAGVNIPGGDMVTLLAKANVWANFAGAGSALQKVYADAKTGALTAAATGGSVAGTLTGSITGGVLTVSAITGTPLLPNQIIWATGVPPGTYIASDGTGTGGTGTYNLANLDGTAIANVTSSTLNYAGPTETQYTLMSTIDTGAAFTGSLAAPAANAPGGVLTVTAVGSGTLQAGQFIAGAGIPTSLAPQILYQLTNTDTHVGGTGTYATGYVGLAVGSEAMTSTAGQLAKISAWQ